MATYQKSTAYVPSLYNDAPAGFTAAFVLADLALLALPASEYTLIAYGRKRACFGSRAFVYARLFQRTRIASAWERSAQLCSTA